MEKTVPAKKARQAGVDAKRYSSSPYRSSSPGLSREVLKSAAKLFTSRQVELLQRRERARALAILASTSGPQPKRPQRPEVFVR
jgi:hypothetical protein